MIEQRRQTGTLSQNLGRITAGLAIAGSLFLGVAADPHVASADGLKTPHIISVKIDVDSTGYVTFEDPNTEESTYDIWMLPQSAGARGFQIATPGVPGRYRIVTRTVAGLTPGASYCFIVDAINDSDRSDNSNRACADPPAPQQTPATPAKPVHDPSDHLALGARILDAPDMGSNQPTTIPIQPELILTDIRPEASTQLSSGMTGVYDVVVANTGAKLTGSGQIQVQIQVTGSVQFYAMAGVPSGFSCSNAAPVVCIGPLGGYGDVPIATSATLKVQVQATKAGIGSLSAAADPNNLIQESDESNDAKTLAITVK